MSKIKRIQPLYSGGVPIAVGDRYYAQDLIRDQASNLDFMSTMMKSVVGLTPQLLRGGICTKGTNFDDLDITEALGIVGHQVTTPDDFSSLPPTTKTETIASLIVEGEAQINLDLSITGNLDGVTTNYVKLRYKEIDGGSRNRAKKSGSYVYEVEPSYEIIVNTTAPTSLDVLLCSFVGDGSSFLTITQEPPYFTYENEYQNTEEIYVGKCKELKASVDVSSADAVCPISNPSYEGQIVIINADGDNEAQIISGAGIPSGGLYITNEGGPAYLIAVTLSSSLQWKVIPYNFGVASTPELKNKRIEMVAGTLRQNATDRTKWDWIKDSQHEPIGVDDSVQAVASGTSITINYLKTYSRVISFIAAPDEAMANALNMSVGGSVGTSFTNIKASAELTLAAHINYNGSGWDIAYGAGQGGATDHNVQITGVSLVGANLTIDHTWLPGANVSVVGHTDGGAVTPYRPVVRSISNTSVVINFIDAAGAFVSPADTDMSFLLTKNFAGGVVLDGTDNGDVLDLDKGNIWFFGIFEV